MHRKIWVVMLGPLLIGQLLIGPLASAAEPPFLEVTSQDVGRVADRWYVAGIVGSSFATLTSPGLPSATDPLFTSGGAAGFAFEMLDRAWRLEVEGRARDPIAEAATVDDVGSAALAATGGWSAMVNLWRDYEVTERLQCYVGGGIGGGGYRFGVDAEFPLQDTTLSGLGNASGFAWQVGSGVAYALTDRVTIDFGYRFFDLGAGGLTAQLAQTGVPIDTARVTSAFSASEIFFAIRIYEPFRWH
jgi:opacity protein-like surface antigen